MSTPSADPLEPPLPADVLDSAEAGARVVRGGALRAVGFVGSTALSVGGAALLTRHLEPIDFGRYQTVISLVTIVQVVTDVGMATLATREYAQRRGDDRARVLSLILGLRLLLTGAGVGIAVLAALALGYDGQRVAGAAVAGFGLLVLVVQSTYAVPLTGDLRVGAVTGLDLLRQGLTTAFIVVLVLAGAGIVPFLAVTIPAHLVLLAATVPLVRGGLTIRPAFDRAAWWALLRPTVTFSLATAVGVTYLYAALVLCDLVATPEETGQFSAAFRVFVILAAVPGVLMTTAFPVLSRAAMGDRARMGRTFARMNEAAALAGGAAAVGTVLGAPFVIDVIAGPDYAGAVDVLRVQGIALALTFVISPWGFALLADHHQRPLLWGNALAFTVSAVTVLVLASLYGEQGAAFGTLLGEATLALSYALALRGRGTDVAPIAPRALRVLPALALGLAVLALGLPSLVATVVGLVVYGVAVFALRAVPPDFWQLVPARLRPRRFGG